MARKNQALIDYRLEGLVDVEKQLAAIIKDYGPTKGRGTLNLPLRKAAKVLEPEIAARTPVETGKLKESIAIRKLKKEVKKTRSLTPQQKAKVVNYISVGYFPTEGRFAKAVVAEYGSKYQTRRHRPLRDSLNAKQKEIEDVFGFEFYKQLKKKQKRVPVRRR